MKEIDIEQAANLIPKGHENAVSLKQLMSIFENMGWLDNLGDPERRTRDIISRVGMDYCVLNLQDGHGYFRPTKADLDSFRRWLAQEESRALRIETRIRQGRRLFEDFLLGRCEEQEING